VSPSHTGTITINDANGGAGYMQYRIDNGANWLPLPVFSSLAPGAYQVSLRDITTQCITPYSSNPVILDAPTGCCEAEDGVLSR
jgi:hypothetical protein